MRRRDHLRIRDVLAGDGMLGRVSDGVAGAAGDGVASTKRNASHTVDSFRDLAALAAGADAPADAMAEPEPCLTWEVSAMRAKNRA